MGLASSRDAFTPSTRFVTVTDESERRRPPVPRVPIIGVDAGAVPGSKPGGELGSAAYLERCGRDIVRGKLRRTRRRDHRVEMPPR